MGCAHQNAIGRILQAAVLSLSLVASATVSAAVPSDAGLPRSTAGQSIYRHGLLGTGEPVRAIAQKGVALSGAMAACVNCHRRSGLGGSEGQVPVRPIAGRWLFSEGSSERNVRWAMPVLGAVVRPAYTHASLARALREGVDPAGRPLDALMPRYELGDEDIAGLQAYLQGLSSTVAPGVTAREIHFSTIIAPDVAADRRRAMLDVMQGFFRDKNGGTRKETRRRETGNESMYRAYRTWVLHVWELSGAPETWAAQLEAHYRQQPVFAVIGGLGAGSWQPVHAFCEGFEVPCVFPDVDYPDVTAPGYYPLYFSRGVSLEAEVLARYLVGTDPASGTGTIVQAYRDTAQGRIPALALREYLRGKTGRTLIDLPLAEADATADQLLATLPGKEASTVLVLWLDGTEIEALGLADTPPASIEAIYVSASLSAMRLPNLPEDWIGKLRMVYPFDLPAGREQRLPRLKAWLRARSIPMAGERTQANAFFAATVTGDAMSQLGESFSRDHFIERIEQMTQTSLAPSIYPHLSLGPGQRFASRGGYLVGFPSADGAAPVPISEWLIP